MYKTKEELLKMSIDEIARYVASIEEESEEFATWCGNDLSDALDELGVSIEQVNEMLRKHRC